MSYHSPSIPNRFPFNSPLITHPCQIDARDTKDAVYANVKAAVNKALSDKGQ